MPSLLKQIGPYLVGAKQPLLLIAGPCVIESEALTFEIAARLKQIAARQNVQLVFKASFDKANRTSESAFRGQGIEAGLAILAKIRQQLELPALRHEPVRRHQHRVLRRGASFAHRPSRRPSMNALSPHRSLPTGRFFIGGAWTAPKGRAKAPVVDPSTEKTIAEIALGRLRRAHDSGDELGPRATRSGLRRWRRIEPGAQRQRDPQRHRQHSRHNSHKEIRTERLSTSARYWLRLCVLSGEV